MNCQAIWTKECDKCFSNFKGILLEWRNSPEETHMNILGGTPLGEIHIIGKPMNPQIPYSNYLHLLAPFRPLS